MGKFEGNKNKMPEKVHKLTPLFQNLILLSSHFSNSTGAVESVGRQKVLTSFAAWDLLIRPLALSSFNLSFVLSFLPDYRLPMFIGNVDPWIYHAIRAMEKFRHIFPVFHRNRFLLNFRRNEYWLGIFQIPCRRKLKLGMAQIMQSNCWVVSRTHASRILWIFDHRNEWRMIFPKTRIK